ncbi:MAG: DNA-directed RNA polymerase subunit omega [Pedosphaera sp.]|nr:DNA-directed RNA polymerase subunit omega [Pedosphaera sp.]MSU44250.1 DNA-directed RNA polymerase subunit omega [Pedosphaera sp.]
MNTELVRQALEKVGNPNVLVNLVSRRVRQLTTARTGNRPLVSQSATMGWADVALTELVEGKMGYEVLDAIAEPEKKALKRKRKSA